MTIEIGESCGAILLLEKIRRAQFDADGDSLSGYHFHIEAPPEVLSSRSITFLRGREGSHSSFSSRETVACSTPISFAIWYCDHCRTRRVALILVPQLVLFCLAMSALIHDVLNIVNTHRISFFVIKHI